MTHQYTKDHHFPTTAMNWMYKYHLYAVHTLIKTGEDKVFRQNSNIPNEEKNKKKSAFKRKKSWKLSLLPLPVKSPQEDSGTCFLVHTHLHGNFPRICLYEWLMYFFNSSN